MTRFLERESVRVTASAPNISRKLRLTSKHHPPAKNQTAVISTETTPTMESGGIKIRGPDHDAKSDPKCGFVELEVALAIAQALANSESNDDVELANWIERNILHQDSEDTDSRPIKSVDGVGKIHQAYKRARMLTNRAVDKWPFFDVRGRKMTLKAVKELSEAYQETEDKNEDALQALTLGEHVPESRIAVVTKPQGQSSTAIHYLQTRLRLWKSLNIFPCSHKIHLIHPRLTITEFHSESHSVPAVRAGARAPTPTPGYHREETEMELSFYSDTIGRYLRIPMDHDTVALLFLSCHIYTNTRTAVNTDQQPTPAALSFTPASQVTVIEYPEEDSFIFENFPLNSAHALPIQGPLDNIPAPSAMKPPKRKAPAPAPAPQKRPRESKQKKNFPAPKVPQAPAQPITTTAATAATAGRRVTRLKVKVPPHLIDPKTKHRATATATTANSLPAPPSPSLSPHLHAAPSSASSSSVHEPGTVELGYRIWSAGGGATFVRVPEASREVEGVARRYAEWVSRKEPKGRKLSFEEFRELVEFLRGLGEGGEEEEEGL
ncbi:hypothetical protein BS50DRAFT_620271 [Corynespora cassiicola Philippines]|uniref:Uncharacterized protein n=1 Tax=Corynespora cassiicola Philippines TaxID=1448308 RepID=A0A2T2NQU0_CORCC|nr:hypothetical protein BS50DRAFT_620271 [Corynespora cassiicola Philippines]